MSYKINDTVVVDDSRNVCACCVTSCCVTASNQMIVPSGNTASRPTGATGSLYFDTDEGALMNYTGSEWAKAAGGTEPSCNCFYIPTTRATCYYGQRSCFNCDQEGFSCVAASMSPNGSTSVATNVCMGTCKYGGSPTQFLDQGVKFSARLDNPAAGLTGLEKGGKGFCYMCCHLNHVSIPYKGLNDTDARATPMYTTGHAGCNTLAVFWCSETGKYQGRCTCACKGSHTYAQGLCPQNTLFRPTGQFSDQGAAHMTCTCQGNFMTSDYCCGVWAGLAGDQCGCCSGAKTYLYVVFGFQPCLLYDSSSCCATPANSPIKYESFCSNYLYRKGSRLTIDWANKRVVMLASESQYPSNCAALQSYCICDKGFPNCQACWCLHCAASCYIFYCGLTSISGISQLCGFGEFNNTTMFNNLCMITMGCDHCHYAIFKLNTQPMCSMHMRTHSNGSPYCTFYMQLGKVFTDNDCSLRFFSSGVNHLTSYPCPTASNGFSGTYDFTYANGQDVKTARPCRFALYTQTVTHCNCVYTHVTTTKVTDHKMFDYEPITNRVSFPLTFANCNTCGGFITGVMVHNLSPKSVGSNQAIITGNSVNGSPSIQRNICSSDCVLVTSETANTSTCAQYWKVFVQCQTGTRNSCSKTLTRVDACGVALCTGCVVLCTRGQLCNCVECCNTNVDFAIKNNIAGHFVCSYTY